jgi:hypothetical protein
MSKRVLVFSLVSLGFFACGGAEQVSEIDVELPDSEGAALSSHSILGTLNLDAYDGYRHRFLWLSNLNFSFDTALPDPVRFVNAGFFTTGKADAKVFFEKLTVMGWSREGGPITTRLKNGAKYIQSNVAVYLKGTWNHAPTQISGYYKVEMYAGYDPTTGRATLIPVAAFWNFAAPNCPPIGECNSNNPGWTRMDTQSMAITTRKPPF